MRRIESFPWWWCYTHSNDREPTKSHFGQLHHAKITNSGTFIETFSLVWSVLLLPFFQALFIASLFHTYCVLIFALRAQHQSLEKRLQLRCELEKSELQCHLFKARKIWNFHALYISWRPPTEEEGVRISSAMSRILNKYTNVLTFFGPNKIK